MAQRNVEWYSVHTNGLALREMAQRNVECHSVDTNSVALCRIALQNIRRSIWTLNCLVLLEIFRSCGESSSLLVAWREGHVIPLLAMLILQLILKPSLYLLIYLTSLYFWWLRPPRLSHQNHQNYILLFFPCRYCIYSLSFMKVSIKIVTRLNSTTVCRPPGLPQLARVGGPEHVYSIK